MRELESKLVMQEQRRAAGKAGGRGRPKADSESETSSDSLSKPKRKRDTRREAVEGSEWEMRQAALVKKRPDLEKRVLRREITLTQAVRIIKEEQRQKRRQENTKAIAKAPKLESAVALGRRRRSGSIGPRARLRPGSN